MTAASAPSGSSFVVDLIGDLDATLGAILVSTFADLRARGATAVYLTTKHVAITSADGLRALEGVLATARAAGIVVALEAGSRKMRAAFVAARIPVERVVEPRERATRHLMIAHHAVTKPAHRPIASLPLTA